MPIPRRTGMYSGLYKSLPVIRAETQAIHGRLPRDITVYLVDPKSCKDKPEVTVVGRTRLWKKVVEEIPFSKLRHIEVGRGACEMVEMCWRDTKEEMQQLAAELSGKHEPEVLDFSVDIDL